MHAPVATIRPELLEWERHATAYRFGLNLGNNSRLFVRICLCIWRPSYSDRANAMSFGAFGINKRVVIGCDLATGLETHFRQAERPNGSPWGQNGSQLIRQHFLGGRGEEQSLDTLQRGASTQEVDRKSTRLNSSHRCISYAVFCLKKKVRRPLWPRFCS